MTWIYHVFRTDIMTQKWRSSEAFLEIELEWKLFADNWSVSMFFFFYNVLNEPFSTICKIKAPQRKNVATTWWKNEWLWSCCYYLPLLLFTFAYNCGIISICSFSFPFFPIFVQIISFELNISTFEGFPWMTSIVTHTFLLRICVWKYFKPNLLGLRVFSCLNYFDGINYPFKVSSNGNQNPISISILVVAGAYAGWWR